MSDDNDLYQWHIEFTGSEQLRQYDFQPSDRNAAIRKALKDARDNGSLVMVLGAGTSLPSGLQNWRDLVRATAARMLADGALPDLLTALQELEMPATSQVRFFETVLGAKLPFRSHLTAALYENYDPAKANDTLDALAEIVLGLDGVRPTRRIITYNFDNVIELTLAKVRDQNGFKFDIVSVYDDESFRRSGNDNAIFVFHPHGYIP